MQPATTSAEPAVAERMKPAAFAVGALSGFGAAAIDLGAVRLPLVWRSCGEGPRVLVVGGTHGDEFEGQLAVGLLASRLSALDALGMLLVLPRHNPPACAAGTQTSPLDGADINRIYPCRGGEGPSAAIAAFVTERLLPEIDWLVDIHSGGVGHEFVLSSNVQARPGSEEERAMRPYLAAFGAPYAIVFDEADGGMPHGGTLEGAARVLGVRSLSSELGGGGRLTKASAGCAVDGLADLLVAIGVLGRRHATGRRVSPTFLRLDRAEHHVVAPEPGLFEPLVALGDPVAAGAALGHVHGAARLETLRSAVAGVVVALPARGLVAAGETAVFVAEPL